MDPRLCENLRMQGLVAIAQVKGGVGKSSLAVHLACAAHRAGDAVVLLDCDPQASATRWVQRLGDPFPTVAPEPGDDPRGATIEAVGRALDAGDLVIADPPPSSLDVLRVLLAVADAALIPAGAAAEELHLAARTLEVARTERAAMRRPPLDALLVATRVPVGTRAGRDAVALLAEIGPTAEAVLHHRIAWIEAQTAGCTVWDLPASRHADAQREASALIDETNQRFR